MIFGNDSLETEKLKNLLTLYTSVLTKLNQEGDGIWSRFNIIAAINLSLIAANGFVLSNKIIFWNQISIVICLGGITLNIWSWYVFTQLWWWHKYWFDQLKEIETRFPENWDKLKIITNVPDGLGKNLGNKKTTLQNDQKNQNQKNQFKTLMSRWIPEYTQMYILIFGLGWFVFLCLVLWIVRNNAIDMYYFA